MTANVVFYPVGNGDMTLIELESGRKILIDVNIRAAADDPDDDMPDVGDMLRKRLTRDSAGRLYVDAFLLSHPDKDHCTGLGKHFHLGPPDQWSKKADKILLRELWSSPMVFRRASSQHTLCDDAQAFSSEARRRVARYRDTKGNVTDGDRILILGKDQGGKTDDLSGILITVDSEFSRVNGQFDTTFSARLLAPQPKSDDDDEEALRSKNHSSTVLNISLMGEGVRDAGRLLTGGDAEVAIWERMWQRHKSRPDWLAYDILLTPHHCSWHTLSYDSWSEKRAKAKVSPDARNALAQARKGAAIVASSKAIKDDDDDPPCIRAKREYESILQPVGGTFYCVGEPEANPQPIEFEIGKYGPKKKSLKLAAAAIAGGGAMGGQPLPHG